MLSPFQCRCGKEKIIIEMECLTYLSFGTIFTMERLFADKNGQYN